MIVSRQFPADALNRVAAEFPGRAGFSIKDLSTDASYEYRADERFPTASVFKVPIMLELFRQAVRGQLVLDERRRAEGDISTHGTGMLKLLDDHPELTLRDYCRLMMSISDNIATDMILRAIGIDAVNGMLREWGLSNTSVAMEIGRWHYATVGMTESPINRENDQRIVEKMRGMEYDYDGVSYSQSLDNNVASPRDMALLLEKLQRGEMAGEQATAAMLAMLETCTCRDMIASHLRPEIEIAHKHGSSHRIKAEVGIVYLSTGPMVIAGFTLAPPGPLSGASLVGTVARMAVEAVAPYAVVREE